jgi:hypothetical protein
VRLRGAFPWWVQVLAIFAVSRAVTTGLLLWFASIQKTNPWTGASPSYFDYAKIWDGHWYYIITAVGYPSVLPMTDDGHVAENAWAFMPGYPAVVKILMLVTGLPFTIAGVIVSVGFAAGAALVFYKLMNLVLPEGTAMFSVVLFCFAPLSPILQVSYAESMHAFLLATSLYLLVQRRYLVLMPVVIAMSLTRPSGLAFALALAVHVVHRWWIREREPFTLRDRVEAIAVTAVSAIAGLAWPAVAWAVTGDFSAYTDTELAWRAAYIGYQELVPFTSWLQGADWWLGVPVGPIALTITVVLFIAAMFTPAVRKLGPDIRAWIASYAIYLLAVFFPQSSTFRLLVPMFPLLGAVAQPKSRVYRVAIVFVFVAAQWGWLHIAWWVDGLDWTPP